MSTHNPSPTIDKNIWKNPEIKDLQAIIDQGLKSEPYDFKIHDICGVPVRLKHFDFSTCIHMRIGFRYGAIHDEKGKEGTAHFLEHMLFDGSNIFEDEKETQEFGKTILLDTLNAYTGLFELFVTGKTLPHYFDTALTGMFSMIVHPLLTEKSWAHEQKVITQEAWGRFLNEKRVAYLKKEKANTMYDLPDRLRTGSALGWPETVLAITHEDLVKAHKKYFVKENMEIFIAGDLESIGGVQAVLNTLQTFIEQTPSGEVARDPYIPSEIGAPKELTFDHTYEQAGFTHRQQTSLSLSSMLPRLPKEDHKMSASERAHLAALTLAGDLIGDLVFRKLRLENSWCYGAGASVNITPDYLGFNIGSSMDKNHVDKAITIIWKIVDDLASGEFENDFTKTKILAIDNTLARERTTSSILDSVVESIKINGAIVPLRQYLEDISKVSFDDVRKVVADYMKKDIVFTEILRPGDENVADKGENKGEPTEQDAE